MHKSIYSTKYAKIIQPALFNVNREMLTLFLLEYLCHYFAAMVGNLIERLKK